MSARSMRPVSADATSKADAGTADLFELNGSPEEVDGTRTSQPSTDLQSARRSARAETAHTKRQLGCVEQPPLFAYFRPSITATEPIADTVQEPDQPTSGGLAKAVGASAIVTAYREGVGPTSPVAGQKSSRQAKRRPKQGSPSGVDQTDFFSILSGPDTKKLLKMVEAQSSPAKAAAGPISAVGHESGSALPEPLIFSANDDTQPAGHANDAPGSASDEGASNRTAADAPMPVISEEVSFPRREQPGSHGPDYAIATPLVIADSQQTETSATYFKDKGRDESAGFIPQKSKGLAENSRQPRVKVPGVNPASITEAQPARSLTSDASNRNMTKKPTEVESSPEIFQTATYHQLAMALTASEKGGRKSAPVRALYHLMQVNGRSPGDPALELERTYFPVSLLEYQHSVEFCGLAYKTRLIRPDALRRCAERLQELRAQGLTFGVAADKNPFWAAIDSAPTGIVPDKNVVRLLAKHRAEGYMPAHREDAASWERKLGLPEGDLQRHCWFWEPSSLFELRNNAYRWNGAGSGSTSLRYALLNLPPDVERAFGRFCEWRRAASHAPWMLEHLDGTFHILERTGMWTTGENEDAPELPETERMTRETVGNVLSFLTLPADADDPRMRGLSIPKADLRITHFFVASNLVAYCKFQAARNGPFDHGGLAQLDQYYRLLIGGKDSFGRHAQKFLYEDLKQVVGEENAPKTSEEWDAWCEQQRLEFEDWVVIATKGRKGKKKFAKARDVRVKLSHLLDSEKPIEEVVWPTILHLRENRPPSYYRTNVRYPFEVRMFTLVAMTAEPLRDSNWRQMRWKTHLDLRDGKWRISIPQEEMKNRRLLSEPYKSTIDDDAACYFDDFYELWKKHFGYDPLNPKEHRKAYVLAASDGDGRTIPNKLVIRDRLKDLEILWGFLIASHAFRHIWATDWLKRFPTDFYTVAGKLNESFETVMAVYGKLRSSDHAQRANKANAGRAAEAEKILRAREAEQRSNRRKAA